MAEFNRIEPGQTHWTDDLNENFDIVKTALESSVPRPSSTVQGVLYQNADGTTDVIPTLPTEQYVYGMLIDTTDPNPAAIVYTDDCRGFVPAFGINMGSWFGTKLYRDIKPCLLNSNGTVNYYIQKDNFNLKAEGINVPSVLTGADGQVMIEFPKLYWDFSTIGNHLYIRIGNYKFTPTAECYAHKDGSYEREKNYVAAYKGTSTAIATSTLDSISGALPIVSQTISTFRNAAQRRGTRWHLTTFYSKTLTSILGLLMYRNRDLQIALGRGFTFGNAAYGKATGLLNTNPFCYGFTGLNDGKQQMKLFGMEDYWGGIWEFVDGLVSTNYVYKTTTDSSLFSDTGAGFENSMISGFDAAVAGTFVKQMHGTNKFPFLAREVGASEISHWADGFWIDNTTAGKATTNTLFGGNWIHAGKLGAFCWYLVTAASGLDESMGSRVFYL